MMDKVRVRFAPSPTGPLHIGGVRTALYNYLFAKKNKGEFILRIEDTDQKRYVAGAEEYIVESLNWLGLDLDEGPQAGGAVGPYRQSERSEIYKSHIHTLIEKGHAYYAFDTAEELDNRRSEDANWSYNSTVRLTMRNSLSMSKNECEELLSNSTPYVIRARIPDSQQILVSDLVRGEVSFDSSQLEDKVLMKSDGLPTYHFANIVDDHLMEISHVIRGEEWLSSAPLHVLLYQFFGWTAPKWVHLPLILKPEGKGKLSKRDGQKGGFPVFPLEWTDPLSNEHSSGYREEGYFPEALINILALLGWNPGTEQELFNINELIRAFSLERINKSGARFDPDKAIWFNTEYLKKIEDRELAELLKPLLIQEGKRADDELCLKIVSLMKDRSHFVKEMTNVNYLFEQPNHYDEKTLRKKWKEQSADLLTEYSSVMTGLVAFNSVSIEEQFRSFLGNKEIGMGALMPLLRLAFTGMGNGPSLYQIMEILGAEECKLRIGNLIEFVNGQN